MPKRRLVVEVVDDEQTVVMTVNRYDYVGGVEIGPTLVADVQRLSFPNPVVEDWQRDSVVAVAEVL